MGSSGGGGLRQPLTSLQDAVFWAGVFGALGAAQPAGIQAAAAPKVVHHIPLRQVGQLCPNTEMAILTLELNIEDTNSQLTTLLSNTMVVSEKELIETWQTDIKEASRFLAIDSRSKRDVISWLASITGLFNYLKICLLYTSPSPRDS